MEQEDLQPCVWIFHGAGGKFASGAFSSREKAEDWIEKHMLTGVLTQYPLDIGVYDWALKMNFFAPKKEEQKQAEFIQRFTSGSQSHYHYDPHDLG